MAIINDLLDISKIEEETYELESIPFSFSALIEDIAEIMAARAREKGLDFEIERRGIEGKIYRGDPTKLRQILTNLCGNAIKFTEHGNVRLSVQSFADMTAEKEKAYISVRDTGIGIAEDRVENIFDKFAQADASVRQKSNGAGLGLSITKKLVEIMEGTIAVESTPGQGSNFIVTLPLALAQINEAQLDEAQANEAQGNKTLREIASSAPADMQQPPVEDMENTVLVVEDYQPNALVAGLYLQQFGFGHDVAENGTIAIQKFSENSYRAILMDVQMHGLDGFQTTQEIRRFEKSRNLPPIRIIGMTAHALPGDREKCLNAGMDDYLPKPFNPDDLRSKLVQFNG
jgi:CheY-like chemotaxis protein/two-component sensor histidine kinase